MSSELHICLLSSHFPLLSAALFISCLFFLVTCWIAERDKRPLDSSSQWLSCACGCVWSGWCGLISGSHLSSHWWNPVGFQSQQWETWGLVRGEHQYRAWQSLKEAYGHRAHYSTSTNPSVTKEKGHVNFISGEPSHVTQHKDMKPGSSRWKSESCCMECVTNR